ncbi:hypothetical protein Bbelb_133510 [Branchiostoma belcheri]|nr:hypothetical protein Bbelb_133510 [Branchiostoma belcheri]
MAGNFRTPNKIIRHRRTNAELAAPRSQPCTPFGRPQLGFKKNIAEAVMWTTGTRVTLQTFHYATNAEKLVDYDDIAPLKVRKYLRPGVPMAGLMTYAKMDGVRQIVGLVPEKEKSAVVEMCGGAPETLHVLLEDAYIKRGYHVIKVDLSQIEKLALDGARKLSEIKRHLKTYVQDELFRGEPPPPITRRRFHPTDRDIRNILLKAKKQTRSSEDDQANLQDSDISIPGYSTLLRKDRKGQVGGGVALLICDLLPCKRRPDLESNNSSWQNLWAEIWVNGNKILVACIYRPPTAPDTFFQDSEHNVAKAVDEKGQIIITGDFNCHNSAWGGTLTDNNGLLLADIVDRYGLYQSQTSKPWISPDLLEMIRHKTDLYHEYKSSLSQEAWNNYTTYKNRLTSELRKAEREFYHTISDKCKSPDASKLLWSVLNRLNGKESRGIPTLSNNGLLVDKEEEKAELLNEIFVNITKDCNHPDRTMKLPILTSKQFTTLQVTREEVLTVLLSLQVDKAPGPDGISNKLLREAAPEICDSLQCLFNYSLSTGTFPTEWKQSNVTPVYKKGDKTDPLNCRPISLLPTVAKLMERLVHNHLYSYLEENNLLHNNQSGFRKGDGTVLQLIRMVNDWARSIDDPDISCTAVVFLDVRRAFDTVWHQGLTYKLTRYGVGAECGYG